jgi:ATP-dependent RNA helicase RhlE
LLLKNKVSAEAIHGNKSQNARQRALSNFKDKTSRVLVATDIAARGIDIDELSFVINYDIPNIPETYVHRIGRTGRAGASGIAVSFCDREERKYIRDIQKLISLEIPVVNNHPFASR